MSIVKESSIGLIKASLNSIPFGSFLTEAIFETPSRIAQNKKNKYLDDYIKKMKKIPKNLIDLDYIQSEEFSDLIQNLLKKIELLRAKESAYFFTNLGVVSTLKSRSKVSTDWQIQFIEILANLNENEIILLKKLYDHRKPSASSVLSVKTPFGLEKNEFQLCFDSLISKGLVYDASLSALPKKGIGSNPKPRERIDLSPLGKKMIQFVEEVDNIFSDASCIN